MSRPARALRLALAAGPLLAGALATASLAATTARAQFVAPEGSDFHNGATLPLQDLGDARERIHLLAGALDRQDAGEAAAILRALRSEPEPRLVPLGSRTDLPAIELAARMIAAGPAAVREPLESQARQALAAARRTRDLDTLLDHATRGSALATAREAGLLAARLLFEQGESWQAAGLAARAGDLPGAAQLAAAASSRLTATAPPGDAGPSATVEPGRWALRAASRIGQEPGDGFAGAPLITDGRAGEVLLIDGRGIIPLDPATGVLSAAPFHWNDHVPRREDEYVAPAPRRHALARSGDRLVVPIEIPLRVPGHPDDPRRGLLLAVDLLPVPDPGTRSAADEALAVAWIGEPEPVPVATGAAVGAGESGDAGDTGAAGDAVDGFDAEVPPSVTLGPPLVAGPRVFVQVFRTGLTTRVSLACFALADGRRLFETPLVDAAQVERFSSRSAEIAVANLDKRAREGPPVERDGIVYVCTGFGVVAAVDGLTGLPRFTFRYDRLFALDRDTYDPAFLFDTGGWDDEPPRLFGDRLVVAPGDSRFLYKLALQPGPRGDLILDDPIERMDRRFIVALRPDPGGSPSPCVLASRRRGGLDGLSLIAPDGHVLSHGPLRPAGQAATGRPLLLDASPWPAVLLPTSAGLLSQPRDDLQVPPVRIPGPASLPAAVAAVFAVRDGFVVLGPLHLSDGPAPGDSWILQFFGTP